MGQEETGSHGGKYFYVKAKNLKAGLTEFPTLELKQKVDGQYFEKEVKALFGHIVAIEKIDETKEISGKKKRMRGVKFTMKDIESNEVYLFDLLYSNPVRELLNRFASLDSFEDQIKITPYRGDKGFAGISVKKMTLGGDVKVEAKFSYNEHIKPRIKEVMFNGQAEKDYTEVDDMFDKLIVTKLANLRMVTENRDYKAATETTTDPSNNSGGTSHTTIDPMDLPFRYNETPLKF